jgi:hypothetical protein
MGSAQLAETQGIIKSYPSSTLGRQSRNFQKITVLNNFSTVRPIFTKNVLIDSLQQGMQSEIIKIFKFSF